MCGPILAVASTALAVAGTVYSGLSANAQGKYENQVAQENRKHELAARDDAAKRGELEMMRHYRQVAQRLGLQRAQLASSGLDVNFGSAMDLEYDTTMLGQEDAAILAENTNREMRGFEINAANYTMQGRAAKAKGKAALIAAGFSAGSTLLSSASQMSQAKAAGTSRSIGG